MNNLPSTYWFFGDAIDTDQILPSQYMLLPLREMCQHAMEPQNRAFAEQVKAGDVIVAGKLFGCGSSREQAPLVLKELGIKAVIAVSFARIFYRNAINVGLQVIELNEAKNMKQGDTVILNLNDASILHSPQNAKESIQYKYRKLEGLPQEILNAGGLVNFLMTKA